MIFSVHFADALFRHEHCNPSGRVRATSSLRGRTVCEAVARTWLRLCLVMLVCLLDAASVARATDIPPLAYIYGVTKGGAESTIFNSQPIPGAFPAWASSPDAYAAAACAYYGWLPTAVVPSPGVQPTGWTFEYHCVDPDGVLKSNNILFKAGVCPAAEPGDVHHNFSASDGIHGYTYCSFDSHNVNRPKSAGPPACEVRGGTNPINIGTGNKYESQLDYAGAQPYPLVFERFYNADVTTVSGHLLSNWRHTYDKALVVTGPPAPFTMVSLKRADGSTLVFREAGGTWRSDTDVADKLIQLFDTSNQPTGWKFIIARSEEVEVYDAVGRLMSVANRAGLTHTLSYDAKGRLASITDSFGRSLQFTHDLADRIWTMVDPDGGIFIYAYDSFNNITLVTYPDGKTRSYVYDEPQFTGGAQLPRALTGVIDENLERYETWTYDSRGWATSSMFAGGVGSYRVSFGGGQSTVTDPLGQSRVFGVQNILGVPRNTSTSRLCGCSTASATSYDANGFVVSRTDFNGSVTRFQRNDPLGRLDLETLRTEAFGKPEARTTTTEWDASFRLPRRLAEPLRITTTDYDTTATW
jgi:YD repeat-containing protein